VDNPLQPDSLSTPKPELKPRFKITSHAWAAGQWGLASLLYNGFMLLCMPMGGLIVTLLPLSIRIVDFWGKTDVTAASVGLVVVPALMTLFTLIGMIFAFSGWSVARSRNQPLALHVAAALISVLALMLWIGLLVICAIMSDGIWNITRS
jgi:hypothetical protein